MTGSAALVSVDPDAIAANVRTLAAASRGELMAVVKADGYGHGATRLARTALAAGAGRLGVAHLDEALALRRDGVDAPVLAWLVAPSSDFGTALAARIEIAVSCVETLRAVASAATDGRPASVHLQVDVGMARDGAPPGAWASLFAEAAQLERTGRLRVAGLMGHLANAEDPAHPGNAQGTAGFTAARELAGSHGLRPQLLHLAATAATLHLPRTHFTMSRVGAGLVGIDPAGRTPLRFAMTVNAPVIGVRRVPAGTPVGYGSTWRAGRATTLALLPMGYADGIRHCAARRAAVQLAGRRCPVVGAVSMDQVVVDAGDAPVAAGDLATVFGPGDSGEPTPRDWARWCGTIPHEILTGLGTRLDRTAAPTHRVPALTGAR